MSKRGTATLPLHDGNAPRWLFDRMVDLGGAIAEVIIEEYGHDELLARLADPYWFQALGCVLGFDWHSSGLTTTTMGALKEGLSPDEHGILIAGGKGSTSRRTPEEISNTSLRLHGTRRDRLARASRMAASVDDAALQDTYTIYHHTMIVAEGGDWAVVQQGMNDSTARRYHWLSDAVDGFVVEPQSAIASQETPEGVLDMTAETSAEAREVSVDLVNDDPSHLRRYLNPRDQATLGEFSSDPSMPHLQLPSHHELRPSDLSERAIDQLQVAYEFGPDDYEDLVEIEGIGRGSLRALALIAELVYDAETSRADPAKYAYAHGGKDGTPYPVERERYDRSIQAVRQAVEQAQVDPNTRQTMLSRLSELEPA